jgi:hypothetical protein
MTQTPTDRIVAALLAAGYRNVSPLELAGISFDFPAAFLGDDRSLDLVLVADLAFEEQKSLLQRVESVARALDVMRSKRPITLVLAGPRPNRDILDAMSRVCRVLPITSAKSEDADSAIRNSLAVLMPLDIPRSSTVTAEPLHRVRMKASSIDPDIVALIDAAPRGADSVEEKLHELLLAQLPSQKEAS